MTYFDNFLVIGFENSIITIFDITKMKIVKNLFEHDGPVTSLVIDSSQSMLISGSEDKSIIIWYRNENYECFRI